MAQSGDSVAGSCPDPGNQRLYQLNELPHGRVFAGPFAGQVFTAQNSGPPTHGQALVFKNGVGTGGFVMQLHAVSGNSLGDLIAAGSLLDFGVPLNTFATATFELDPPNRTSPELVKGQQYAISVTQLGLPPGDSSADLDVISTFSSSCGSDVPSNGFFFSTFPPENSPPYPAPPLTFVNTLNISMIFTVFTEPTCQGELATDLGTPNWDRIVGTKRDDVILTFGGRDKVLGKGGDDIVCGGPGSDTLTGHAGDDALIGGKGSDSCSGRAGDDELRNCEK